MKKIFFFLLYFTFCFVSDLFSQDIMTLKNGDEIKIKVLEILPDLIKYKKWDNPDGPTYSENKANVFMIKYPNGTKDVFTMQTNTQAPPVQISNDEIKKNDAVKMLEKFFINGFKTSSDKVFNLLEFKKTNGVMRNIYGQSVYQIDFELTIQFLKDAWKKGNSMEGYWQNNFQVYLSKPDLYASGQQYLYDLKFFPRGTTYRINGIAMMENTDNGYNLNKYELKTFTNLGVRSVVNDYGENNSEKPNVPAVQIINKPVEYKAFNGYLSTATSNSVIKISNIRIADELNNISEAQQKILGSLSEMRRLQKPNWESNNTAVDTLLLEANAAFSYRNYSSSALTSYFADCNLELKLINSKTASVVYNNNYQLTNYKLLSNGFASALDANKSLIANSFNQSLSQFITGNFPLSGEITEVTDKNKKQTEAKTVKINIGRSSGIFIGYNFIIPDYNSKNADISVTEAFDDYCLCKVNENGKRMLEDLLLGKKIKIVTPYKP